MEEKYLLFTTQHCPNCPTVKKYMEKSNLKGKFVDAGTSEGMDLAIKHEVNSVPTVIFMNNENEEIGRYNNVEQIKTHLGEQE